MIAEGVMSLLSCTDYVLFRESLDTHGNVIHIDDFTPLLLPGQVRGERSGTRSRRFQASFSDYIRKLPFHLPKIRQTRNYHDYQHSDTLHHHHWIRSSPSQQRPAKALNNSRHRIEPVEPPPLL